jgi:hypothetical protein
MLSSSGAITNIYLDKWKIFYRYGVQIKALLLNAKYRILRNKIVE